MCSQQEFRNQLAHSECYAKNVHASFPVRLLNSKLEAGSTGRGALRSQLDIEGRALMIDISVSIKKKKSCRMLDLAYPMKM